MTSKTLRTGALAAILAVLMGCTSTLRSLAPHEFENVGQGRWLQVETVDGRTVEIKDARADAIQLSGVARGGERREIPLASIRAVRLKTNDPSLRYKLIPMAAVSIWLALGAILGVPGPAFESCPFVYSYDGRDLVFDAEPYGAAIAPALKRTEWTPLPHLRDVDGEYRIRIANQLEETQYTDEARLVVVDHPAGTQVATDPGGQLHVFRDPAPPLTASDQQGRDLTGVLRATDDRAWLAEYGDMDARTRETLRDPLLLEFAKPANARTARLLVSGTTAPWGGQFMGEFVRLQGRRLPEWRQELQQEGPALQILLTWFAREGLFLLPIEIETRHGWQARGMLFGSGPFVQKITAYALDVSDVEGDRLRVRLRVPVNFWVLNSVAVDYGEQPPIQVQEVETSTLRDARGREVQRLLSATDDAALVMAEGGDVSDLAYPAPPPRTGKARTVFLKISGHYDIHLPAEGEPQEALLRRVLLDPGYTLRFAYERHLEWAERPEAITAAPGGR